jgi:hypothetical protein
MVYALQQNSKSASHLNTQSFYVDLQVQGTLVPLWLAEFRPALGVSHVKSGNRPEMFGTSSDWWADPRRSWCSQ